MILHRYPWAPPQSILITLWLLATCVDHLGLYSILSETLTTFSRLNQLHGSPEEVNYVSTKKLFGCDLRSKMHVPGCHILLKLGSPWKFPWLLCAVGSKPGISWPLGCIGCCSVPGPLDSFWAIQACASAAQSTWPVSNTPINQQAYYNMVTSLSQKPSFKYTLFLKMLLSAISAQQW